MYQQSTTISDDLRAIADHLGCFVCISRGEKPGHVAPAKLDRYRLRAIAATLESPDAHDYLRCSCHQLCCVCQVVPVEIDVDVTDDGDGGVVDATRIITVGAVDCRELGHNHRPGDRGFACAFCAARANAA